MSIDQLFDRGDDKVVDPYVIAEIGCNHQGRLATAVDMIRAAADSGADCVKFQKRSNRHIYVRDFYQQPYETPNSFGKTYGKHRESLEFGADDYECLMRVAEECGVGFLSTPFDIESADFLNGLGVSGFKIASGDITNAPLLEYVAALGKPIFMSTGACSMNEVIRAYNQVEACRDKLCILHCTSAYPAPVADLNLRCVSTLRSTFPDVLIGYSGHEEGEGASLLAYALGAVVFERHFTLDRSWKGTDQVFSLDPAMMRKLVEDLKVAKLSMGDGRKELKEVERSARTKLGKSIYTSRSVAAGELFSMKNLCIKSPAVGLAPYLLDDVIGRRARRGMASEQAVDMGDLA